MDEGAGGPTPSESLESQPLLPSQPDIPTRLPSVVSVESVRALLDRLSSMASDEDRLQAVRDELRGVRALGKYLTRWRSYYCARLWLEDVPTHVIAKLAGVAGSYVSRRARQFGLPPRRNDKRRDG